MVRSLISPIIYFCFSLSVHAQEDKIKYFYNENINGDLKTINFTNNSEKEIEFSLRFNNNEFFQSADAIIDYILNMDDEFENEPVVRKVWRFSRDMRYHNVPLSEHCWYSSNPTVLFNSTGFGFCGDIAAINYILWEMLGYETRYWAIGGHHVVSEVFHNGKWEMYDSDVEVYYLNREYKVASVEELESDVSLIYDPVFRLDPDTTNRFNLASNFVEYPLRAYSTFLAEIYETEFKFILNPQDYCHFENYTEPQGGYASKILLPPHSKMEFLGMTGKTPVVSPLNRDFGWEINHYSNLRLTINSPWSGQLNFLPLIVKDIEGSGTIKIVGNNGNKIINDYYKIGSDELNSLLEDYWVPMDALELEVEGEAVISFFVNQKLFPIEQFNYLFIEGDGIDQLQIDDFWEIPSLKIDFVNITSNFCEGEAVDLTFNYLPGFDYHWYHNEEKIDDENQYILRTKNDGIYSLKLISPWGDEISLSESYSLEFHDIPEIELIDFEKIYFGQPLDLLQEVKESILNSGTDFKIDWLLNGEVISTSDVQSSQIQITSPGNYQVVVSNGKCTKESKEYFVRPLYHENDFQHTNISVFPNPFQERINLVKVDLDNYTTDLTVEVINSLGKKIMEFEIPKDLKSIEIDLSSLSSDIYTLRIIGNENRIIRLIKE